MTEELFRQIASTGVVGSLFVGMLLYHYRKENQWEAARDALYKLLADETRARVQDARDYASGLAKMQEATNAANEKSSRLVAEFEKFREDANDREIRELRDTQSRKVTPP